MPSSISWGLLLLAGLSCLATGCLIEDSEESDAPKHDQENSASHKIAPNLAEFAFSLYRVLAHESNTANIFFSPVSIATALGSLSLGTKADTHTQIMEGVGFNLTEISETVAGGVGKTVKIIDFSTGHIRVLTVLLLTGDPRRAISPLWDVTVLTCHGQCCQDLEIPPDLLVLKYTHPITQDGAEVGEDLHPTCCHPPSLCPLCPGTLEEPFKADHTMEQDFYVNEATTVRVPMMNRLGMFDLHYCLTLSSMVLKMKYLGNVTAIFIMPKVGRMEYVEDTLTKEFLDKLLKKDYSG
uniref:Serpin domain-containing protein n=1 Tax=Ictidomys tridecemlineatus TaxID=43179 RepID=I3MK52_ICTTR